MGWLAIITFMGTRQQKKRESRSVGLHGQAEDKLFNFTDQVFERGSYCLDNKTWNMQIISSDEIITTMEDGNIGRISRRLP